MSRLANTQTQATADNKRIEIFGTDDGHFGYDVEASTYDAFMDDVAALLQKYGLQGEEIAQAKPERKAAKSTTKTTSKKSKASKSDDFDRTAYEKIARELGCMGKRGVYKACRQYVYGVMDGSMTKAQAKRKVKAYTDTF